MTASGVCRPILINSIPKAGTHLVSSVLNRVPGVKFSGQFIVHDHFASTQRLEGQMPLYNQRDLSRAIRKVPPGTFANCHLFFDEFTENIVSSADVSPVFIVRDPRDIVVSQLHYIEAFKGHHSHRHLTSTYSTRSERLDSLIFGWKTSDSVRGLADIGTRLRSFKGWPNAIPTFKFEEFAQASSRENLEAALFRLLQAVGLEERCDIETAMRGIGDKWSPTLNTAAAGRWREVLTPRQSAAIADLASDYLAEYGYESS
ncbi:sulfotransferase domain-containing protein [Mycolicibacterium duvalii]|nr:sulfotransferase domain-containing protein [Mycolicibacterium duvalii]MCV7370627.1 sulfotransferase domain-containing protein [Mycolicibacterium duvalii]